MNKQQIKQLNKDIQQFPQVFSITDEMKTTHKGVSKLVMLDRYSFKDTEKKTLKEGDFVVLTVKDDPKFPARGLGIVDSLTKNYAYIKVDEEYRGNIENEKEREKGIVKRDIVAIDKPLEIYYEQIALRNANGLSQVEKDEHKRKELFDKFYNELKNMNFIPAGRVLYGAGSETDVTFFNCFVMPYPKDSREGISEHRKQVMEIMSRGGGVGTNGSTLRPRNALARGVNGKSSGSVSWMDDIAKLTHLVEQGGSRRGAQMLMISDWHPDVIEFIISKMQNPKILKFIIETTNDEAIKRLAENKLKFTPFTEDEKRDLNELNHYYKNLGDATKTDYERINKKLSDGGTYSVHNPEFLTGANISVCLTKEFMESIQKDEDYKLQFPDIDKYTKEEMRQYNDHWYEVGDIREWRKLGYKIKTYKKIKAKELWNLICICATYSAEPGIFFIDNANEMTNARAYGQKVVATNPLANVAHADIKPNLIDLEPKRQSGVGNKAQG